MLLRFSWKNDNGHSSAVPIKSLTDKRNITLTFVISLSGSFLSMQIIYQGKIDASQPRGFKFLNGFAVSQNPKHYSNEQETLSLIDKIIRPYFETTRKELKLQPTQKLLLIWDVCKRQKTDKVLSQLASLNIEVVSVPANMTLFPAPGSYCEWRGKALCEGYVYSLAFGRSSETNVVGEQH